MLVTSSDSLSLYRWRNIWACQLVPCNCRATLARNPLLGDQPTSPSSFYSAPYLLLSPVVSVESENFRFKKYQRYVCNQESPLLRRQPYCSHDFQRGMPPLPVPLGLRSTYCLAICLLHRAYGGRTTTGKSSLVEVESLPRVWGFVRSPAFCGGTWPQSYILTQRRRM